MAKAGPIGVVERQIKHKSRKSERTRPGRAKRKMRRGQGKP